MNAQTERGHHHEDIVAFAWKALGILLALGAFALLSIGGLVEGEDPTMPLAQGVAAFLLIWGLNRVVALLLGLHDTERDRPDRPRAGRPAGGR